MEDRCHFENGNNLNDSMNFSSSRDIKYSVIIRNISFHCTEEHLREFFNGYISSLFCLTVRRNDREKRSLLHAFADFLVKEDALALIQRFNNSLFMGRRMQLEMCRTGHNRSFHEQVGPTEYQIHAEYQSFKEEKQERITEEIIQRTCSRFGYIIDTAINRHTEYTDEEGHIIFQRGFAFVYFRDYLAFRRAGQAKSIYMVHGKVHLSCSLSHRSNQVMNHRSSSMFTNNSPPPMQVPIHPPVPPPLPSPMPVYPSLQPVHVEYPAMYPQLPPVAMLHPNVVAVPPPLALSMPPINTTPYLPYPSNSYPLASSFSTAIPPSMNLPSPTYVPQYPASFSYGVPIPMQAHVPTFPPGVSHSSLPLRTALPSTVIESSHSVQQNSHRMDFRDRSQFSSSSSANAGRKSGNHQS